jgi:hypothetical protein
MEVSGFFRVAGPENLELEVERALEDGTRPPIRVDGLDRKYVVYL